MPVVRLHGWATHPALAVLLLLCLIAISGPSGSGTHLSVRVPAPAGAAPALLSPSTNSAHGDWTMYLGTVGHQGVQKYESAISPSTAANLTLRWSFPTLHSIVTQPIVSAGRIFFGSWDGYEYAINEKNGSLLWKIFTGKTVCAKGNSSLGVSSTATASAGKVYFGGGGQYWYAVSSRNGTPLWTVYTGNNSTGVGGGHYNWASPLIYRGNAYIGLSSTCDQPLVRGTLMMVNLTNHSVVHTLYTVPNGTLGGGVWGTPTADASTNTLYFATGNYFNSKINLSRLDDSVVAVNASTLQVLGHWHIPQAYFVTNGDFGSTPVLYHTATGKARVGAVNKDGTFFAFARNNLSSPVMTINISTGPSVAPAAFDKGTLFMGAAAGTAPNGTAIAGSVQAINATSGALKWIVPMPGAVLGSPTVANGVVVAGGGTHLVVLDEANGTILYQYNATKSFFGAATVSHGWIYVGNNNGSLLAFGLSGNISKGGSGGGGFPHPGLWAGISVSTGLVARSYGSSREN